MNEELMVKTAMLLEQMNSDCKYDYRELVNSIKDACDYVKSDKFSGTACADLGLKLLELILVQQCEIDDLKRIIKNGERNRGDGCSV